MKRLAFALFALLALSACTVSTQEPPKGFQGNPAASPVLEKVFAPGQTVYIEDASRNWQFGGMPSEKRIEILIVGYHKTYPYYVSSEPGTEIGFDEGAKPLVVVKADFETNTIVLKEK